MAEGCGTLLAEAVQSPKRVFAMLTSQQLEGVVPRDPTGDCAWLRGGNRAHVNT